MSNTENSQKISYLVFLCTIVTVLLTLIPVVFPALFSSYFGLYSENLDAFETGYLASFLIISKVDFPIEPVEPSIAIFFFILQT